MITGSTLMSSTAHLHIEVEILNVNKHHSNLNSQFLVSTYCLHHPNHFYPSYPKPPGQIRQLILSALKDDTDSHLTHQNLSLNLKHTEEVSTSVFNLCKPLLK